MINTTSKFSNSGAVAGCKYTDQCTLNLGLAREIDLLGKEAITVSLAVARTSPSRLISIALKEDPWAGIMLTLPVASSTI